MNQNQRMIDAGAWFTGAITMLSFWQHVGMIVTVLVGIGSLSLIALRWYDRIKYGPRLDD